MSEGMDGPGAEEVPGTEEDPGADDDPGTGGIGGCSGAGCRILGCFLFKRVLLRFTEGSVGVSEDRSKLSYLRRYEMSIP